MVIKPNMNRPEIQGAIIKSMQTGYGAIKGLQTNRVRAHYMNSEYNRLRNADNAGIRHRIWQRNMAFKESMATQQKQLSNQKLALDKEANRMRWDRIEDSKTGALIGNLLNLGGIAYNKAEQSSLRENDKARARTDASSRVLTADAIEAQGGTLSPEQEQNYIKDFNLMHGYKGNPKPGIRQRIFGGK